MTKNVSGDRSAKPAEAARVIRMASASPPTLEPACPAQLPLPLPDSSDPALFVAAVPRPPCHDAGGGSAHTLGRGRVVAGLAHVRRELREARRLLDAVLLHASVALVSLSADGVVTALRGRLAPELGLTPGRSALEDWRKERECCAAIDRALQGSESDATLRRGARVFALHLVPLSGGGLTGVARAIAEGEAEPAARAGMEARLAETALKTTVAAVAITDASGRLTFVNAAFLRVWGHGSPDDVLGLPALDLWCDAEAATAAAQAIERDGRWEGELVARRADGSQADLRVAAHVFRDRDGAPGHMVATFEDVTELRTALQRLAHAQRMTGMGAWSAELNGRVLDLSPEAAAILGVEAARSRLPLASLFMGVHAEDRTAVEQAFERLRAAGEPLDVDLRLPASAGGWRSLHAEARVATDARGEPAELQGIIQDVTPRVRLEEQLRRAQKDEAVGRFAGGIAHDFNNLLTIVQSCVQLLRARWPLAGHREELLGEIALAAERGSDLVRQLLSFGRPSVPVPRHVSLRKSIEEILPLLRRLLRESVRLVVSLEADAGCVVLDPTQLERIVVNLVVNAHDAMPRGGQLTVALGVRRLGAEAAARRGVVGGEYAVLTVRDTGPGIPPEVLAHVFEPFYTTKGQGKGSGLGLSIVREIAHRGGGFVDATNEPEGGARFDVCLPRVGAGPLEQRSGAPIEGDLSGSETILVVEDDASLRWLVSSLLEVNGYRVLAAGGYGEAVELLERGGAEPDLLLSDIGMPDLMGPELASALARFGIRRVVFMSGYAKEDVERLGVVSSRHGLLTKPFGPLDLLREVRRAIGRGPEARGAVPAPSAPVGRAPLAQ